jgi:hypothetical protein
MHNLIISLNRWSTIKTATMKNNVAVTIPVIVRTVVSRVLEVAPSLAMDTSSMDSEINTVRRIVDAKNAIKIANKISVAKILKKSAKKRKSARGRRNAANLYVKIIAVMIITALVVGAMSSTSRIYLILRTKEALSPSLIR